jgi:hypothetical protein
MDAEKWLEELTPHAPISRYEHNRTGEDNAVAHLTRQVMGREVVVAVTRGVSILAPGSASLTVDLMGATESGSWSRSPGSSPHETLVLPLLVVVTTRAPLLHLSYVCGILSLTGE